VSDILRHTKQLAFVLTFSPSLPWYFAGLDDINEFESELEATDKWKRRFRLMQEGASTSTDESGTEADRSYPDTGDADSSTATGQLASPLDSAVTDLQALEESTAAAGEQVVEESASVSPVEETEGVSVPPVERAKGTSVSSEEEAKGDSVSPVEEVVGASMSLEEAAKEALQSPVVEGDGASVSPVEEVEGASVSPVVEGGGPSVSPVEEAEAKSSTPAGKLDADHGGPDGPSNFVEESSQGHDLPGERKDSGEPSRRKGEGDTQQTTSDGEDGLGGSAGRDGYEDSKGKGKKSQVAGETDGPE
jgi:hypothetical protein